MILSCHASTNFNVDNLTYFDTYSKYSSIYVHKTSLGSFGEVGAYFPLHFYRTQFAYIKSLKLYSKIKSSIVPLCVCWGGGGGGGGYGIDS